MRAVEDLAWFRRDDPAETAAELYLSAHEVEIRAIFGLTPEHELYLAGRHELGETTAVAFRGRCNGVELEGQALFIGVSTTSHWLGPGVVDRLYSTMRPGLECPYTAADLISGGDAVTAALTAFPDLAADPTDFSGEMWLGRDGTYVWEVRGPFPEPVVTVGVNAYSSEVLWVREPDSASVTGYVAGEFKLADGYRLPDDVVANYPMKFIRVLEEYWPWEFVTEADTTGWFSGMGLDADLLLKVPLETTAGSAAADPASGAFWHKRDGEEGCGSYCCGEAPDWPEALFDIVGNGQVNVIENRLGDAGYWTNDVARVLYVTGWSRMRHHAWSHELPPRVGLSVPGGNSKWCGTYSRVTTDTGATQGAVGGTLHEAAHTIQHCAVVAGAGCGNLPGGNPDAALCRHANAVKEGFADFNSPALTSYRLTYPDRYRWERTHVADDDRTDWFVYDKDIWREVADCDECNPSTEFCKTDLGCGGVEYRGCVRKCAVDSDCAEFGPAGPWNQAWPVFCDEFSSPAEKGCSFSGYNNAQLLSNAYVYLRERVGPMQALDWVTDGYEVGWDDSTRMAGCPFGNNI